VREIRDEVRSRVAERLRAEGSGSLSLYGQFGPKCDFAGVSNRLRFLMIVDEKAREPNS